MSSLGWWNILEVAAGIVIGGGINWLFSLQASKELRREAEKLRRLTLKLFHILDGANLIDISEWDAETGEPSKWPVTKRFTAHWQVEAPTPWWKRLWKRMFGG